MPKLKIRLNHQSSIPIILSDCPLCRLQMVGSVLVDHDDEAGTITIYETDETNHELEPQK